MPYALTPIPGSSHSDSNSNSDSNTKTNPDAAPSPPDLTSILTSHLSGLATRRQQRLGLQRTSPSAIDDGPILSAGQHHTTPPSTPPLPPSFSLTSLSLAESTPNRVKTPHSVPCPHLAPTPKQTPTPQQWSRPGPQRRSLATLLPRLHAGESMYAARTNHATSNLKPVRVRIGQHGKLHISTSLDTEHKDTSNDAEDINQATKQDQHRDADDNQLNESIDLRTVLMTKVTRHATPLQPPLHPQASKPLLYTQVISLRVTSALEKSIFLAPVTPTQLQDWFYAIHKLKANL